MTDNKNLYAMLERRMEQGPARPAFVTPSGAVTSYADLARDVARMANALAASGVKPGDRVTAQVEKSLPNVVLYLATLKAGAIAVSINAIFKADEVKYILNDSGARVLFTTAELLDQVPRDACPALQHVVLCEGERSGETPLEAWLDAGAR